MKKTSLLILFSFFICTTFAQKKRKTIFEYNKVYFQNWSGGQELSGSGTDFYISLNKPLSANLTLEKIYFQKREAKVDKISDTLYVARFYVRPELVIDEYGNRKIVHKQPELSPKNYILKDNEAILQYSLSTKKRLFKFLNVTQKEMLAYP